MNYSLDRLLKSLNEKLAVQEFKRLDKVDLTVPGATFEDYLESNPPKLTVREQVWYRYVPAILKGVSILFRGTVVANAADLLSMMKGDETMNPSQINTVTNIIGLLLAVLEPVRSYLSDQPFNWGTFLACIGGAVIAYFTGKSTLAAKRDGKEGQ